MRAPSVHSARQAVVLAIAAAAAALFVISQADTLPLGLGTPHEMRMLSADEGVVVRGIWNVWNRHTLDYQKAIHTGYYYYTAVAAGALLVPWLGNRPETFALGARWYSLLQGAAVILLATWVAGSVSRWAWPVAFLPVFLAFNPHLSEIGSAVQVDVSLILWMTLATWALSRFLLEPALPRYRAAAILASLAFASKPAVLPYAAFFVAANGYQIWRDGQSLRREWPWRVRKGLKYFLLTLLLASPFTFFSPGLFVASMRSEMAATATKFTQRSAWDWLPVLGGPGYVGYGLLLLGLAAAVALLSADRLWPATGGRASDARELRVFVAVNGAWAAFYWVFVLVSSRSFIDRYLSPAFPGFLYFVVGALALLGRRGQIWAVAGGVALAAAFLPSLPARWALLEQARAAALTREARLEPQRAFAKDLRTILKPDDAILADAFVNLDPDTYVNTNRMLRVRERYFSHQPRFLLLPVEALNRYHEFLAYKNVEAAADRERKLSAVFFNAVKTSRLFGTVEPVKTWTDPGAILFRFTVPTDAAYVANLFRRLHEEADLATEN